MSPEIDIVTSPDMNPETTPATSRSRRGGRYGLVLALVLPVLAGAVIWAAPQPDPAPSGPPAAREEPVTSTSLGCPGSGVGRQTQFGIGLAPLVEASDGGGLITDPEGSTPTRGGVVTSQGRGGDSVSVRGTGGSAQGLFAWRADRTRGLAVADCSTPRASWWFIGAGAALDHESTLVLQNLDGSPAIVDVAVFGPDGPIDVTAAGGRGITVPPGELIRVPMVELAPQTDELAVQVAASQGRVVAAIADHFALTPTAAVGNEWLPAQLQPIRQTRIVGVPGAVRTGKQTGKQARVRQHTLIVANPGDAEAVVDLELSGPNGRSTMPGTETLSIAPGSVATVDLTEALDGAGADDALAVVMESSRPVVGAMRTVLSSGDHLVAGMSKALDSSAATPVLAKTGATGQAWLHLVAGAWNARADVVSYQADGTELASEQIGMAAHALATYRIPKKAAYVMVTPTKGQIYGATVWATDSGKITASTRVLRALPDRLRIPGVRPGG